MPPTWEYRIEARQVPADLDWLNEIGNDGWEVCAVLPIHDAMGNFQPQIGHHWLFKRLRLDHPMVLQAEEEVPEGAINRAFREFNEQNPGVSAALQGVSDKKPKRTISPEQREKMRAARWGNKSSAQPAAPQESPSELEETERAVPENVSASTSEL